jgi:hypothetical protein
MPAPHALSNLDKGVGRNGRTLQDIWREKGFSEDEIEAKTKARLDLIKASRARNMAARQEKYALTFGLGDAVQVAVDIEKRKKELNREFRNSPLKGVRRQSTVLKRQQKELERQEREREKAENPRIKGLAGVPGVTTDADGTITWQELKKQRPDVLEIKPYVSPGARRINEKRKAEGRKDRYVVD